MNTRTSLIVALGLLSLSTPAVAQAAPAKLAASPTAAGVTVKITNPNRYSVSGSVQLLSGKKTISSKQTSVAGRHSKTISLPARGLRSATLVAKLGRRGSKATVTRRAVSIGGITAGGGLSPSSTGTGTPAGGRTSVASGGGSAVPSGGSTPPGGGSSTPPGGGGNPDPGPGGGDPGNPPPPPNTHWTATDLTNGGDPFGLEVADGRLSLDGSYLMPVFCQEVGGSGRWAWSNEVIDEYQNWALGNQSATRYRDTVRANLWAGTSLHRVTYKITSQLSGNQITGTISQSFAAPRWENNHSVEFLCSGSLNYSATQ